jgi:hypothetical protein
MALPLPTDRDRWQMLTYIVGAVSVTGRLEDGRPQSLLIIGPPSSGKSALLERYLPPEGMPLNQHMIFATSASQWGIRGILERQVPRVTHLVIPEFQALTLRKSAVWDSFLGIMLPAMEEGVKDFYVGPKREQFHGARLGLITSVATTAFQDVQPQLSQSGFLSRLLVVHLNRTPENALKARRCYNAGDHSELRKVYVSLPNRPIKVRLASRLADIIDTYAHALNSAEVHRVGNRFQALAKAAAFLDGKSEVQERHWDHIKRCEALWLDQS